MVCAKFPSHCDWISLSVLLHLALIAFSLDCATFHEINKDLNTFLVILDTNIVDMNWSHRITKGDRFKIMIMLHSICLSIVFAHSATIPIRIVSPTRKCMIWLVCTGQKWQKPYGKSIDEQCTATHEPMQLTHKQVWQECNFIFIHFSL